MAKINADFLISEKAPDFIFFEPQTIDNRFPSLDDGASWPILLYNYQPIDWASPFLILKKNSDSKNQPNLELILKKEFALNEVISIPKGKVFTKIFIQPTFLGKIIQMVWKPSEIYINATGKNGETKSWRFITGMGKTGFLISPLVNNSTDFTLLYSGNFNHTFIETISFTIPNRKFLWQKKIKIEFYSIDNPLYSDLNKLLKLNLPEKININDYKIGHCSTCTGNLDIINAYKSSSLIKGEGWMVESIIDEILPDSIYLWIEISDKEHYLVKTDKKIREDVGAHFKNPKFTKAGFTFHSIFENPIEIKTFRIVFIKNKTIYTCDPFFLD